MDNLNTAGEGGLGMGRAGSVAISSRLTPRVTSSPVPSPALHGGRQQGRLEAARRKTISLNDDEIRDFDDGDDTSLDQSSLARESTWSPASALEADDDASVRPIPPSVPPSPSPSRSSSSYLSDPRTFRSIAASTKPTTLLSIDLNGNGMAHIAQAPMTPPSYINRFSPHVRSSSTATNPPYLGSGTSITFSALPQSSSLPSSLSNPGSPSSQLATPHSNGAVQAPLHTTHHPRNNPRPSSPPLDNASVLTLASSAYAIPGLRTNNGLSGNASGRGVGDSLSHFGGSITYADGESTSQFLLGDEGLEERDADASVRALRPRSSRRGSWESEASRWSARVQAGTGTPSLARDRSLWTTNSVRTGGFSTENAEVYDRSDEAVNGEVDERRDPTELESQSPETSNSLVDTSPGSDAIEVEPPSGSEGDKSTNELPDAGRKISTDTPQAAPAAIGPVPELSGQTRDGNTVSEATVEPVLQPHKEGNGTVAIALENQKLVDQA